MKSLKFLLLVFLAILMFGCKKDSNLQSNSQLNIEEQLKKIINQIPLNIEYDGIKGETRYFMPDGRIITQFFDKDKSNGKAILNTIPIASSTSCKKADIKLRALNSTYIFPNDESTPLGTIEGARIICTAQREGSAGYSNEWIENPTSFYTDCRVLRKLFQVSKYWSPYSCSWNGFVNYIITYRDPGSPTGWGVFTVQRSWSASVYV
ncbi:hypothetical protein [Sphingobacterium multivorum]|uniref:hypothetical protein n=1 Tax=Sphingobacterium multivorum TaxID=28454 RepID=UPI0028A8D0F7|nr:hypothetical protein [Sphingobacterium multivorum]